MQTLRSNYEEKEKSKKNIWGKGEGTAQEGIAAHAVAYSCPHTKPWIHTEFQKIHSPRTTPHTKTHENKGTDLHNIISTMTHKNKIKNKQIMYAHTKCINMQHFRHLCNTSTILQRQIIKHETNQKAVGQ